MLQSGRCVPTFTYRHIRQAVTTVHIHPHTQPHRAVLHTRSHTATYIISTVIRLRTPPTTTTITFVYDDGQEDDVLTYYFITDDQLSLTDTEDGFEVILDRVD